MADETNILDHLVGQVPDEQLRARLAREIDLLRGSRRFGLVFDRHLPESIRLPDHPIRKGVRVALRDESSAETWTVLGFTDKSRQVAVLGEGEERPIGDLVVIREFGEPVYPGLESIEWIQNGPADAPWHTVINGENFHALQALRSTHRGKVDLIYIDPPYNTGNDGWIYNDRYVDQNDRARSSKWLSFLERRLLIARDLLKPTGVIITAIGDEEHHRLRMLMDQVFGIHNFLSNVVWQGRTKSYTQFVSNGADYMLIYAKDMDSLVVSGRAWRERKPGVDEALAAAARFWSETSGDSVEATRRYRAWIKKLPAEARAAGVDRYNSIEEHTGRVFSGDHPMAAPESRPNRSRRPLIHPVTGRPCKVPPNGWRYSDAEMDRRVAAGLVVFGEDETKIPRAKSYLDEIDTRAVDSTFVQERNRADSHLSKILGDKRFPYPKDHEVLMRWIRLAAPKDAVVLDFFGGSGTTTEAVLRLNAEDDGNRQSILVTNNEVGAREGKRLRKEGHHPGDQAWETKGVFEYVCRPRVSTVVMGKRPDGSEYSAGLPANVEFFNLAYLDPGRVRRGHEYESVAPLMWLEGGAVGERIEKIPEEGWALRDSYGVLFTIDALAPFADTVTAAAADERPPRVVFVITDSPTEYQQACERLPVGIETVRLYQDYLSNYTINVEGGARR